MLKRFIVIIIIDIVLIGIWDYWINSIHVTQGESIAVVLIVPVLIIASGIVGLILKQQKNSLAEVLLVNVLFAFIIFAAAFKYEFWKQQHDNYLKFYFTDNDKIYSITLNVKKAALQNGMEYHIYERLGEDGNGATDLDGSYMKRNDTIILTSNKGKLMKIVGDTLFNYPEQGNFKVLRDDPE